MGSRRSFRTPAVAAFVALAVGLVALSTGSAPSGAEGNEAPGAPGAFRSFAAGGTHSCALVNSGRVKCWGANASGRLGLGDTLARGDGAGEMGANLPAVDLGFGRTATAIAAGNGHTCALLDNGTVKCWGSNAAGRLGLGDTLARGDAAGEMGDNLPAVALGTGRTAVALTAGNNHTCALLNDGTVKCWGNNASGQLGLGNNLARGDGAGEMGDSLPVVGLGTGRTAVAIAAGNAHTCALLDNATIKCWGDNASGRLGLGNTADRGDAAGEMGDNLPAVGLGTSRTALAVTAGDAHTCALLDNATIKCWGENASGRLGLGDTSDRGDAANEMANSLPAVSLGTGRIATAVTAGDTHTCAQLDNLTVKCWGDNAGGQLGLGDNLARGDAAGEMGNTLPAVALGAGRTTAAVTAGGFFTCARLDNDAVKCWGNNTAGQLGLGDTLPRGDGAAEMGDNLPIVDLTPGRTIRTLGVGVENACALLDNGTVKCWGNGSSGRLGNGSTLIRGDQAAEMGDNLATVQLGAGRTATALAVGGAHSCAILDNAQLKCWGTGSTGRLGIGPTDNRGDVAGEMGDNLPAVDLGTGRTAIDVAAGGLHTCAVLDTGQVKCWGFNSKGQLGLGDTATRGDAAGEMGDNLPAVDLGTGRTAVDVAAAGIRTCALLDDGSVKCWGDNAQGQLGLGDTADRGDGPGEMGDSLPTVTLGTGRTVTALSIGGNHACAILDNGTLKCWGNNSFGKLGLGGSLTGRGGAPGDMGDALPAVSLGTGRTATAISAASNHTCAVLDDDSLKCWGRNNAGQLGLGDTTNRGGFVVEMGDALATVDLGTGRTPTAVSVEGNEGFTCATLDDGRAKCWGDNAFGQLGQGDPNDRGDQAGEMGDNLAPIDLGSANPLGISGTVSTAGSGARIPGAFVAVLGAADFTLAAGVVADPAGNYRVEVPPGTYFVYVIDPAGRHAAGFAGAPTAVNVTTPGLIDTDAALAPTRGAITGKIVDQGTGDPIADGWALSLNATGAPEIAAQVDPSDIYTLDDLPVGNHFVAYLDPAGAHPSRFFPDSPNVPDATPLAVTAGGATDANGELPTQPANPGGAALTGTVTEAGTALALADVLVIAMNAADFGLARAATTNASGAYTLDVAPGSYKLVFFDTTGAHAMEWHNNQPYHGIAAATNVTAPTATNAVLDLTTGAISGTLTDQTSGAPLAGAWAFAISATGTVIGAVTNPNGTYTITGLPPGTYRATYADPVGGRAQEYFDNSPTYDGGTNINVTAGNTTPNINAALANA